MNVSKRTSVVVIDKPIKTVTLGDDSITIEHDDGSTWRYQGVTVTDVKTVDDNPDTIVVKDTPIVGSTPGELNLSLNRYY